MGVVPELTRDSFTANAEVMSRDVVGHVQMRDDEEVLGPVTDVLESHLSSQFFQMLFAFVVFGACHAAVDVHDGLLYTRVVVVTCRAPGPHLGRESSDFIIGNPFREASGVVLNNPE